MNSITYAPLEAKFFGRVIELIDTETGKGFYSEADLADYLELSLVKGTCTSFVALDGQKVVGLRLTLAKESWEKRYEDQFAKELWPKKFEKIAYFKSNFISANYQNKGIGSTLSGYSLQVLKDLGYQAVLCHSWQESPGNSSQRYLLKLGFSPVKTHKKFWYHIDYECVRCHPGKCICSAIEMLLEL